MNHMQVLSQLLGTSTDERTRARVLGMRLGDTCGRCGGCGRYSFNAFDGDRCFGCGGLGQVFPAKAKLAALVKRVQAAVDSGELASYLANLQAKSRCKNAMAKVQAAWGIAFEGTNEYVWHQAQHRYGAGADRRRDPKYTRRDAGLARINRRAYNTVQAFDKFSQRFLRLRTKNWHAYEIVYMQARVKLSAIHALATRYAAKHPR